MGAAWFVENGKRFFIKDRIRSNDINRFSLRIMANVSKTSNGLDKPLVLFNTNFFLPSIIARITARAISLPLADVTHPPFAKASSFWSFLGIQINGNPVTIDGKVEY
jgi:hypothetical protein